jgi:hypothetical protein
MPPNCVNNRAKQRQNYYVDERERRRTFDLLFGEDVFGLHGFEKKYHAAGDNKRHNPEKREKMLQSGKKLPQP